MTMTTPVTMKMASTITINQEENILIGRYGSFAFFDGFSLYQTSILVLI